VERSSDSRAFATVRKLRSITSYVVLCQNYGKNVVARALLCQDS